MILLHKAEKQKLQSNMNSSISDRIVELDRKIADLEEKRNNQDLLEEIKNIEKAKSDTKTESNQEMSEVSAGLVTLETQKINKKINSDIRKTLRTEKIKIHTLKYKE